MMNGFFGQLLFFSMKRRLALWSQFFGSSIGVKWWHDPYLGRCQGTRKYGQEVAREVVVSATKEKGVLAPVPEPLPKTQQPFPWAPSLPNALSPCQPSLAAYLPWAISTEGKNILYVCYPEPPLFQPLCDASNGDALLPAGTEDYIHVSIQQRNAGLPYPRDCWW